MKKKFTLLLIALLACLGVKASPPQQDDGNVAKWNGTEYATLQDALDAAEAADPADIVIDLLADATLDITAWDGTKNELSIGTSNTQSITINGNDHTLTFNKKNSDWNNIATMNDAQTKLILNNIKLTDSGYNNGPWNRYDLNFNCAVEMNNVTSSKALAFKNAATLKNVTVNEAAGNYSVWVQANGQNIDIDGLNVTATNGGRGIKIADEYSSNTSEVTTLSITNSTFNTSKKSAILLLAAGGVQVIDNGNNNIENVAADNVNLVWVDEGDAANYYRYSLTSSSGATMVPESKETDYVARLSDADGKILGYYKGSSAIATAVGNADTDYTVTIFQAGEYTMPDPPKNITIEGAVDGVVFNHTSAGNVASVPNGATFKNLTFNFGNVDYHGFQHAGTINMEDCTLNGKFFSYGNMNFTNCNFNHSGDYHMWTYAGNITYTGCTFTNETKGKFLNIYNDQGVDPAYTVVVTDCKFINKGESSKAALNVKATYGLARTSLIKYDVYITNCITEGAFPEKTITQPLVVLNNLVQVDDRTATGVDNIRVWQDEVQIYPLPPVAKIGDTGYPTLQSAIDAAYEMTGDVTIELIDDITEYAVVKQKENLNLTIEGKDGEENHTITGQIVINGMNRSTGTETLAIKDINFSGESDNFITIKDTKTNQFVATDAFILVPNAKLLPEPHYANVNNYAHNVTIKGCSFTSTSKGLDVVGVKTSSGGGICYNLVIEDATGINLHSLAQLTGPEKKYLIDNCNVVNSESFVNVSGGTAEVTISNNTFTTAEGADGYGVRENGSSTAVINLTDNNFTAANAVVLGKTTAVTAGTINVVSGTYVGDITKTDAATGKIVISGGHFSAPIYEDAYAEFIAEGLYGIKNLYPEDEAAPNGVASGIVKVTEVNGDVTFYPSLQAAVDAAGENATVTPLVDIDLEDGFVTITKPVVIDGNNHVITSAAAQAILLQSTTAGTVKIQNADITASAGHGIQVGDDNTANIAKLELGNVTLTTAKRGVRVYSEDTGFGISIANSTIQSTVADPKTTYTTGNDAMALSLGTSDGKGYDVTIDNTVLQGYSYLINSVTSGSNLNVTMNGGETYGRAAVNVWGSNNNITLEGVEVHGLNNQTGPTEAFSCIVENIGAQNNVYTIKDSEFIATLSDAAANTEGSSATEQMIDLRGSDSTVKILGSTTYECNYPERGGLVYDESAIENNKFYFDDTAKATFADAFDKAVIADEKEQPIDLYPVTYTSEVYYYWITDGVEDGVNTEFATPYLQGWLADGEFIRLKKNFELGSDITCALGDGTSYTITFGDFAITKGDYSVSLLPGVTVYTDKQTDIFSAATEGYQIYELATETGYAYTCGNYVAKVDNTLYETFAEAATAAAGKKVITLLANISDEYMMSEGETLKVEKNAYDVSPSAPSGFELKYTISGNVTIYTLQAGTTYGDIAEGYYHIKNLGNQKYVNVMGRRTATVNTSDTKSLAGTVIKVKATNGQVEVLRSQAVDIPRNAERAMSYVPDFAKLVVEKLHAGESGEILGTTGYDAIMQKFNDSFDYHLYVEQAEGGYRIFGRTPGMKPVVEFYQENKANVDAKLPQLESFINKAIDKVVDKMGRGESLRNSFKLHTIWQRMGGTLTEPNDDASKVTFLQEVLANETNVWNFAYQAATFYMEKVENSSYFSELPAEVTNYWNLAKQVRPDFKYYIVQKNNKMDIISEGNTDIINGNGNAIWALEEAAAFTVNVPEENSRIVGATFENGKRTGLEKGYYTTLYTDFAYQLPEGAVALKVTEVKDAYLDKDKLTYEVEGLTLGLGLLVTEEIGQEVPAQTPVLIMAKTAGDIDITVGDSYGASANVSDNLLHGADYLINEYEINTPTLEGLFELIDGKVSASITDKYEHLLRRNAGTVNNKYFFSLDIEEDLASAYKKKTGYKMQFSPVLTLSKQEGKKLAFNESWDKLSANSVFLFSEEIKPVLFTLTGDVTRDGIIDASDVTGQTNIIQSRDKEEYNYDYEAADVIYYEGTDIDASDVTGEVNIIQKRTEHPDIP